MSPLTLYQYHEPTPLCPAGWRPVGIFWLHLPHPHPADGPSGFLWQYWVASLLLWPHPALQTFVHWHLCEQDFCAHCDRDGHSHAFHLHSGCLRLNYCGYHEVALCRRQEENLFHSVVALLYMTTFGVCVLHMSTQPWRRKPLVWCTLPSPPCWSPLSTAWGTET